MPERAPGGCERGIRSCVKCPDLLLPGRGGGDDPPWAHQQLEPGPRVTRILAHIHQKTQTWIYWPIAQQDLAPIKLLLITS